jgi:2-oxoisovalerate dehydrogenase E1 component
MENMIDYSMKLNLYRTMVSIRVFEELLLDLFSEGRISGTTHTCIGQEAVAATALAYIKDGDAVFSNHRCHGHYIAFGGDIKELLAEIMGKCSGVCSGRGGSQHLCYNTFFTNGIQGGMLPCAAGYAFASKLKGHDNIAIAFIGDGTLGEGIIYETLNMTSLWKIPLLIVIEDNGYAQTTPSNIGRAGNIIDRIRAFQIDCDEIESNDIVPLYKSFSNAFNFVRNNRKPFCQIVRTYRLAPHSKGDDFRDKEEIEQWRKKDPIKLAEQYIRKDDISTIWEQETQTIHGYIENIANEQEETLDMLHIGVTTSYKSANISLIPLTTACRFVDSINAALLHICESTPEAIIMGEDILDPYGGAFKVTKGISTKFPDKVIPTPISEAAIAGVANGLSLNGMRPIIEVMFGDFITLMYDQILNHAAKFKWMYKNKVHVPVLIRMPTGGKRGYGPTHSQSIEKIFFGIPNILVVAPTHYHNPGQLMVNIYRNMDVPVIFVENKLLYSEQLVSSSDGKAGLFFLKEKGELLPTLHFSLEEVSADATIICYGAGLKLALDAAFKLMIEDEINIEVICPALISPLPNSDIYSLISNGSRYILILDESFIDFGWSSEVAANLQDFDRQNKVERIIQRIGSEFTFISSSKSVEKSMFPSTDTLVEKIRFFTN